MLNEKPYLLGRTFIFSVTKGEDILPLLQEFCKENQIKFGVISSAIGSVSKATFGFYDQKNKKYNKITMDKELEILSIQGNVSLYEHKPMIHAHITFSDSEGKTYGGHLMSPTNIFSCEMMIQEITGSEVKSRKLDKCTQLLLWPSISIKK